MKRMVFLLGFMGCGKTYWAKRLSGILSLPCYDLDELIEQQHEMTVKQIFEKSGESAFRDIEKQVLHQFTDLAPGIIAAGGGTPCFFDNMDWMNANGLTIYLKTPVDLLAERLKKEHLLRPLLAKVEAHTLTEHIEYLVAQREQYYNKAAVCLEQNADNMPVFEKTLVDTISAEPG